MKLNQYLCQKKKEKKNSSFFNIRQYQWLNIYCHPSRKYFYFSSFLFFMTSYTYTRDLPSRKLIHFILQGFSIYHLNGGAIEGGVSKCENVIKSK